MFRPGRNRTPAEQGREGRIAVKANLQAGEDIHEGTVALTGRSQRHDRALPIPRSAHRDCVDDRTGSPHGLTAGHDTRRAGCAQRRKCGSGPRKRTSGNAVTALSRPHMVLSGNRHDPWATGTGRLPRTEANEDTQARTPRSSKESAQ